MDSINHTANDMSAGGAGKYRLVPASNIVIYVVDHGTSGPIARAVKVGQQLKSLGQHVTLMVRDAVANSAMLDPTLNVVPYTDNKKWIPSAHSPQRLIKKLKPDVLLVDEYPFINAVDEPKWEPVIKAARRSNQHVRVEGMTCDIPIYPKDVEAENLTRRAKNIDRIFVTGDPKIVDFTDYVEPGKAEESVRDKRSYVGFMQEPRSAAAKERGVGNKQVLVYLGGHEMDHVSQYVSLLANIPHMSDELKKAEWHIVLPAHPHMTAITKIAAIKDTLPIELQQHIHLETAGSAEEFTTRMAHASMIITGGGQTAIEAALVEGVPTVIVPTRNPEQRHRAMRFDAAMPDRVAQLYMPHPRIQKITRSHLMRQEYYGEKGPGSWIEQTVNWAETSPDAAEMRATIERIYAQHETPTPRPQIMLDGARRIASAVVAEQINEISTGRGA